MRVLSLFSGAGGFDLGMINAGHEIVWANDIIPEACETYKSNIGNHIFCGDISEVDFNSVPDCDVIIGGFPCQGFSIANMNRKSNDPRNKLYLEFLRSLTEKRPKYFLAENVRGILSLDKGTVFKNIVKEFTEVGYTVQHMLVNASEFGVPQNRFRVFIFGTRSDISLVPEFTISKTHGKGKRTPETIGDALMGIPEPEDKHDLLNHVCSKFKLKKNGYINHRMVDPKKPSPTITARGDTKGGAMINHHPNNHRRLSVREVAIIQTFPLDFEFHGNMTSCYLQIGNAVPPRLGEIFGKFLNNCESCNHEDVYEKENHQLDLFM